MFLGYILLHIPECQWIPVTLSRIGKCKYISIKKEFCLCSFTWISRNILFVWRYPFPPNLLNFQKGFSEEGHILGQLVQVNRGEEVSDALILCQAQEVLLPIKREGQGWSEGDKALLVFRGGLEGGKRGGHGWHGGNSNWWWMLCWIGQRVGDITDSGRIVSIVWKDNGSVDKETWGGRKDKRWRFKNPKQNWASNLSRVGTKYIILQSSYEGKI